MEEPKQNWNIIVKVLILKKNTEFFCNELEKFLVKMGIDDYWIDDSLSA